VTLQPEFEAEDSEEVARGAVVVVSHARVAQGRDSWVTKNRMAAVYRELSEQGWRVQLVAREGSPSPYLSTPVPGAVEVLPIRPGRGLLRAAVTAARLIRRSLVVLAFMPSLIGSFAPLIAGRRAVVCSGSSWTLQGSSRRRVWLERAVARRAAPVVAHGDIVDEDRHVVDWARRRLNLQPGITGLWQVLGRSEIPLEEMVRLDHLYITSWSLFGDLKLVFRTLPDLLRDAY
jgi:hypothetical protein